MRKPVKYQTSFVFGFRGLTSIFRTDFLQRTLRASDLSCHVYKKCIHTTPLCHQFRSKIDQDH
jgi:hypothetical protein